MVLLASFALFVVVSLTATWIGLRYWARPKETLDRIAGIRAQIDADPPVHPSLALRDFLARLGSALPASPKEVAVVQRNLIRAGIRHPSALKLLYGSKVLLLVLLPAIAALITARTGASSHHKLLIVAGAAVFGFLAPTRYLKMRMNKRQKEIRRGLPNALDLMVVCVESGLGLDQAILQVAKELQYAHPEMSEEFAFVNLELKAGKRRHEALRNLAERTDVEELRKLVAVLIQADRFGTGVAQSLRGHADFMRVQARQVAEEKAAKVGVKLVFPIFFCILPTLFVVTVGPIIVRVMRELAPALNGIK